eukprot:4517842-Lingulodinium_polyedra.AAC.1
MAGPRPCKTGTRPPAPPSSGHGDQTDGPHPRTRARDAGGRLRPCCRGLGCPSGHGRPPTRRLPLGLRP